MATFALNSLPLAQAGESGVFDMLWAILLVLFGVGLLIGVIAVVRKRFAADLAGGPGETFSLSSLRQLVREGKMTQEEFEKAKQQIVIAHHKAAARDMADQAVAAEQAIRKGPTLPPEAREQGSGYVPPPPAV